MSPLSTVGGRYSTPGRRGCRRGDYPQAADSAGPTDHDAAASWSVYGLPAAPHLSRDVLYPPYGRARPAPGATWSMMSNALDAAMRAACSLKFGIPFRMYPPAFIDRAHAAHPKDDFSALMPVGPPRQSGEKLPAAESMSS